MLDRFDRISPRSQCPICEHKGGWCLISKDKTAIICARMMNDHPVGTNGAGWLYKVGDRVPDAGTPIKREPPAPARSTADWAKLARDCTEALSDQDDLPDKLGVDAASLGRLEYGWLGTCYTFPMKNAAGNIIGMRTRYRNGDKRCVTGSQTGLFIPLGLESGRRLWICEGPSDCAALLTLGQNAIGRPSNVGGHDLLIQYVRSRPERDIVICADRDVKPHVEALTMNAVKLLASTLREMRRHVRVIRPRGKDIREWVRSGLTRRTLEAIASDAEEAKR